MPDSSPRSKWHGGISELAVMLPIRRGRVPGQRVTYEERARTVVGTLSAMAEQGLPTPFNKIPSLHFGRVMIIRPEQYLRLSKIDLARRLSPVTGHIDPYETVGLSKPDEDELRSWLYALVIFDGDPMTYLREITEYIEDLFDRLFENCEDYPYAREFDRFWTWVLKHQVNTDLLFTPYPDLSVVRIKYLEAFKREFDAFVAKVRTPDGRRIGQIDDAFDEFLRQSQQIASDFPTPGGVYKRDRP